MAHTADLMDGHLTDRALEALTGERAELLEQAAREHLDGCASCQQRVGDALLDRSRVSEALRVELSDLELDALVRATLDATASQTAAQPVPALRPSRRALLVAAALGTLTALGLGALSLDGLPSVGRALSLARDVFAISDAVNRVVDALVPGGWGTLALALSVLLAVLLVPLRKLAAPRASRGHGAVGVGALTLGLLLAFAHVPHAQALDFTGEWPAHEELTLVVEDVPQSVVLERAAQAAGLGFVGSLAIDAPTHLRVHNASLRDIVTAVLGADAPLVAERTATLLIVRAAPRAAEPAAATPPVSAHHNARDRVSFGGDVTVRAGEIVKNVVTMGGDATIEGEVLEDVVTMGGDVHVRRGGIVRGEIVAMGGEVRNPASDHQDRSARDDRGTGAHAVDVASNAAWSLAGWLRDTLASASRHALLFLFGLLLLGLAPTRLDTLTRAVAVLPVRAGAVGLLSAIATTVLAIVLIITIIGIPGAVLLALGAALAVYTGLVAVAAVVGRILPIRALRGRPVLQLAAGVLVLFVVARAPFVGALVPIVAALIGLGAVVATRAGTRAGD